MDFEWDDTKDKANQRKHGISFAAAARVFGDEDRTEHLDDRFRNGEQRWATTGQIDGAEVYVVYTMRGDVVRLISARKANRYEREEYWNRKI